MNPFDRLQQMHDDALYGAFRYGFASGALFMLLVCVVIYHKQLIEDLKSLIRLVKSKNTDDV